ncbi:hypothetical protein BS654_27305 (plasmid) [Shigella flexneri 4c]|nr:hypothetical protein BS654_27305 [Shigella flexneri 4c]
MVVEHAHGLRQRRGPNAKSSLHKAHLAPDAGLQAPGASLSFAQGSHDFEWHCCKVSDEAAFCLIQRPYISKTLLTRRISPRGSP